MNAWERAVYNSPARRKARERKARKAAAASPRTALPSVGDTIRKSLGLTTDTSTGVEALTSVQGREAIMHPTKTQGDDRAFQISGRTRKPAGEAKAVQASANKKGDLAPPDQPAPPRPAPLPFYIRSELRKAEPQRDTSIAVTCAYECGYEVEADEAVAGSFADACAKMDWHYGEAHPTDA
jgi:hypothetical protein